MRIELCTIYLRDTKQKQWQKIYSETSEHNSNVWKLKSKHDFWAKRAPSRMYTSSTLEFSLNGSELSEDLRNH